MKFDDRTREMFRIVANRVTALISNNKIPHLYVTHKNLVITEDMVADIHESIGISIIRASNDMDCIRIPQFGIFQVYEGRRNTLDYIANLKTNGLSKEDIRQQMKVDIDSAYKKGILSKQRKGFKLV